MAHSADFHRFLPVVLKYALHCALFNAQNVGCQRHTKKRACHTQIFKHVEKYVFLTIFPPSSFQLKQHE